jgi:hypothetical protein
VVWLHLYGGTVSFNTTATAPASLATPAPSAPAVNLPPLESRISNLENRLGNLETALVTLTQGQADLNSTVNTLAQVLTTIW